MPGQSPSFVSESLWQTPHASTRTRTSPAPGSGISRSTISKGPPGRVTCATRIVGMCLTRPYPDSFVVAERAVGRARGEPAEEVPRDGHEFGLRGVFGRLAAEAEPLG